ncbi:imidazole glycerol phosphate synthase subunit HisF [Candidatus Vidania fulgoroideorum]
MLNRIIACLDIKDRSLVKGKNFISLENLGNPINVAKKYFYKKCDEIVILNVNKTCLGIFCKVLKKISRHVFIPITAGGNIKTIEDVDKILETGVDRISLNSSLFRKNLIEKINFNYGSQCIVASIDVKNNGKFWEVFVNGGKTPTGVEVLNWGKKCLKRGVGEILLTSIDKDGTNLGFDIKLINYVSNNLSIPVIPSGGAGGIESLHELFHKTNVKSVLLASYLHKKQISIKNIRKSL